MLSYLKVEVKFGERDQKGDFTLRHGDWVQFNIATDRRDHLQKATNISLLDDRYTGYLYFLYRTITCDVVTSKTI